MPPRRELTLGQGTSSGGGFSSPALRSAINAPLQSPGFTDITPGAASNLLAPRVTADTGLSSNPSASMAAAGPIIAPKSESNQAATTGQVGTPLGGLLSGLTDLLVHNPRKALQKGFMDEAAIESRANQLTIKTLDQMGVGADGVDAETMAEIQAGSLQDARDQAEEQNQRTGGAVVGGQIVESGLNAAIKLSALDNAIATQVKQMERSTVRFINGVEHNARIQKQARNIVSMRENLRTIDSILTQSEGAVAGQQQQSFLRNPVQGTRL